MQDYKKVFHLIIKRTSKLNLIFIIFFTFLVAMFESAQLFFIFSIISDLSSAERNHDFIKLFGVYDFDRIQFYIFAIICSLLAGFLLILSIIYTGLVAAKIATKTTVDLFNTLADANYDIAKYSSREEYQQAIAKEGDTLSIGVLNPWFQIHIRLFSLIFIFIALSIYDINATIIAMLIVVAGYFAYLLLVKDFINKFNIKKTILSTERLQLVSSVIFGKRDVYIYKLGPKLKELISNKSTEYFRGYAILHIIGLIPRFIFESFFIALICIFVLISFIYKESFSIASFGVIGIASLRILPIFQALFGNYATIKGHIYCIDFFNKLELDSEKNANFFKSKINKLDHKRISSIKNIKLENISIKSSNNIEIISKKNFYFQSGKKYLIQGPSGSGKSTLIDALIGLVPIQSGNIFVDGNKINTISQINTDLFSVVSQKVNIFEGTIKYNITFHEDDEIDIERLNHVIEVSKINDYLPSLEKGLDSIISETGSKLSGGQLQRIAIARALYKKSNVLILDEATNGLEESLEMKILDAIEESYQGIIIYISHNSSYRTRVDELINI